MGVGHQQTLHKVLFLDPGGRLATTTAALSLVVGERLILHITLVRQGNDHVFRGDQIFDVDLGTGHADLGATLVAVLLAHGQQFVTDHFHQANRARQDVQQLGDEIQQRLVLFQDLFVLEASQLVQTQVKDGLGLLLGQVVVTVANAELGLQPLGAGRVVAGFLQHGSHVAELPALGNQARFRIRRGRAVANKLDHRIDVGQRYRQTFQDVRPIPRLAQFEHGPAGHHFTAVQQERIQDLFEVHHLGLVVIERHHVDAERGLHLGVLVEIVQHNLAGLAALDLDNDAHAVLVGLIAQGADALDLLLFDQLGDLLDQTSLVHLIGDLVNDDGLATTLIVHFHLGLGTHIDGAATSTVRLHDAGATVDDAAGGEIRPGDIGHQLVDGEIAILDQRQTAVDYLGEVVRRNVGRHAHRNTGGAVDQQVGNLGGHDSRDHLGAVIVGHPVHGLFVQIRQQLMGDAGHPHFGITHGRSAVAVDRTEVALTVDQHIAHGEILRHPDDGVIHGTVAVRVIFTDYVTDHTGRFFIGLVPVVPQLVHCIQNAAVNRFQAITHIRQSSSYDHAHGVIKIGTLELFFDVDRRDLSGQIAHRKP